MEPGEQHNHDMDLASHRYAASSAIREQRVLEDNAGDCEMGGKSNGELELHLVERQCDWEGRSYG